MSLNCTVDATRAVAVHHLVYAAADFFNDWKTGSPLASMLELFYAIAKFILVAIASVLIALVGIILSVLVYIRELNSLTARLTEGSGRTKARSRSDSTSRDRDGIAPSGHPRVRIVPSQDRIISFKPDEPAVRTIQLSPIAPPKTRSRSSDARQGRLGGSRQRSASKNRRRTADEAITEELSPLNVVLETVEGAQHPRDVESKASSAAPRTVMPKSGDSDSSTIPSDNSVASSSMPEPTSPSGRGVLQRIRERHNHLRERCVVRAQSMPLPTTKTPTRPSRPPRRTDPYQAPFFFPTPMSPAAGTYLQEVIHERQGLVPQVTDAVTLAEHVDVASPRTSPKSAAQALPEPGLTQPGPVPPASTAHLSVHQETSEAHARRHRWSWHIGMRPHLPDRAQSTDSIVAHPDGPAAVEDKELFSKFKFGHHRRRHGVGSDVGAQKAS